MGNCGKEMLELELLGLAAKILDNGHLLRYLSLPSRT